MRRPVFKRIAAFVLFLGVLAAPGFALAQAPAGKFTNPLGAIKTPGILIENMINWMLALVGILTLGALIWGGTLYIISFGNEGYIKQAKTIIFWALVGFIIVTLSYVILYTVSSLLGVAA
jgi:hypothetical protein